MDKLFYENLYIEKGAKYVCGVDEVGRGPLAGPVTVCAVIMDLSKIVDGVDDSKKLSEKKREKLFPQICEAAVDMSIVSVGPEVIDEINILNATKQAMQQAIMSLKVKPDVVLVDAVQLDIPYKTHAIIKGDSLSYSIGCASILAKVTRDAYDKSRRDLSRLRFQKQQRIRQRKTYRRIERERRDAHSQKIVH